MSFDSTNSKSLIKEQVSAMLVEPLQAASVVLAAGPSIFNSSEPLRIPTLNHNFDPQWIGEGEEIPVEQSGIEFGEIELMPTARKSIKSIITVTNELIRMADKDVSSLLQARLVADVRTKLDDALLAGDGADNTVTGLLNQPVDHFKWDVADPDTFLDALALLASREVTPTRFIMNGTDFYTIRKLKDQNGRHLLQSDLSGNAPYSLHGMSVSVSNKIPAGKAILADMKQVAVVRDIDPRIDILTERYAEFDKVGIRVKTRYDLGLIRPESVLILDTEAPADPEA